MATLAGAIAAVLSALATLAGVRLAGRASANAERAKQAEDRRQAAGDYDGYLERLQAWSTDIYAEKDRMIDDQAQRYQARLAEAEADCDRRLERLRLETSRTLRQEQVQMRAQVLTAQSRERYWYRAAQGRPIPGERPPPPPEDAR